MSVHISMETNTSYGLSTVNIYTPMTFACNGQVSRKNLKSYTIYVTAQMCRRTEEEVVPTVGLPTP